MSKFMCKLCAGDIYESQRTADDICVGCRKEHGIRSRTEPARPRIPCLRCKSKSFVRVRMRERASVLGKVDPAVARPSVVTFALKEQTAFWSGKSQGYRPELDDDLLGPLTAYVCRGCGFTELYTERPADIPIGEIYATELFEIDAESPYR